MDRHIRSGRTTRMLAEAVKQAREGWRVEVVGATMEHAERLRGKLGETGKELGILVTSVPPDELNIMQRLMVKDHEVDTLLVDHYTVEVHFAGVLKLLHMFDTAPEAEDGTV